MAGRIKYHYALDKTGRLISVEDVCLEKRNEQRYTCLGCGAEMILKAGKIKARHFAHKVNTEHCGAETYLHKLAKRIIKNKFDTNKNFEIEYIQTVKCADAGICPFTDETQCKDDVYKTFDLRKFYDTCEEEQNIDGYKADILLSDSTGRHSEPVLIEIRVSHKSTEQKITSGLKIIEVKVSNEEDINALAKNPLKESKYDLNDNHVAFYGFRREAVKPEQLYGINIFKFILFESGKTFVQWRNTCHEAMRHHERKAKFELLIKPKDNIDVYSIGYVMAKEKDFNIYTCGMCRFHRHTEWPSTFFCCLSKKRGTPKNPDACEAIRCPHYSIDQSLVQAAKNNLQSVIVVDITKK